MVNKPLIRPYFLGVVALGGVARIPMIWWFCLRWRGGFCTLKILKFRKEIEKMCDNHTRHSILVGLFFPMYWSMYGMFILCEGAVALKWTNHLGMNSLKCLLHTSTTLNLASTSFGRLFFQHPHGLLLIFNGCPDRTIWQPTVQFFGFW